MQDIMAEKVEQQMQGPESPKCQWDLVVAFDIGTRCSGYAYSDKKEIKKHNFNVNNWMGDTNVDQTAKAPTVVLLDKNKKFDSFGYKAEERYAEHVDKKTHMEWYRFRNFKMKLYEEKDINENLQIPDDKNSVFVPAEDIFAFAIKAIKDHFEEDLKSRSSRVLFDSDKVLYVVTVPAIWSESAKEFMKKAAIKAGVPEAQILLALEPETAALFCRILPERMVTKVADFKPGSRYMVLDLGGGTLDIVVHRIMEDGTLAEVYKASGGAWGGTVVDEEFKKFVYKLFNNESCLKKLWEIAPLDALELERDFEAKKRKVSTSGKLSLRLPQRLKLFANTNIQEGNSSITLEHIYIQNEEFKSFFAAARKAIIKIIENILNEAGAINSIILVGGFSCSKFLRDEIMNYSGFSNINFLSPFDPGLVVLQGAVLFGYDPQAVSARISRYTYGVRVLKHYNPQIHPESKRCMVDGKLVCKDVFHAVVYEGDLLRYNEEKIYMAISNHHSQARKFVPIQVELFQTKHMGRDQVAFATDEGITSVGKIICWPPEKGWPDEVKYKLKFYFGQTNIRIDSYETANNIQLQTKFEVE